MILRVAHFPTSFNTTAVTGGQPAMTVVTARHSMSSFLNSVAELKEKLGASVTNDRQLVTKLVLQG